LGLQFPDGNVTERAVERARFGMGENKQNFHGAAILVRWKIDHKLVNPQMMRYML
jgi:hypothetical protein